VVTRVTRQWWWMSSAASLRKGVRWPMPALGKRNDISEVKITSLTIIEYEYSLRHLQKVRHWDWVKEWDRGSIGRKGKEAGSTEKFI
jgi:hypothetical protein